MLTYIHTYIHTYIQTDRQTDIKTNTSKERLMGKMRWIGVREGDRKGREDPNTLDFICI